MHHGSSCVSDVVPLTVNNLLIDTTSDVLTWVTIQVEEFEVYQHLAGMVLLILELPIIYISLYVVYMNTTMFCIVK